jgi:hypothetical protein
MNRKLIAASCLLASLAVSCGGEVDDPADLGIDQDEFTSGELALRGHEDLLRFGIEFANSLLNSDFGIASYFEAVPYGEECDSSHTMLHGNCVTDSPDSIMTTYYGVSSTAWQFDGTIMDLHFLRDYYLKSVYSAKTSCVKSRDRVINATSIAMQKWQAGDRAGAEYWVGHATHIIQDSFSAAHTARTGTLLRTLTDVCTFGRKVKNVCYHELIDSDDRIWNDSLLCQLDPNNREWECLTPQAQSAAYATGGYLRLIGRHVQGGFAGDLPTKLNTYFDTISDGYTGYHNCGTLK